MFMRTSPRALKPVETGTAVRKGFWQNMCVISRALQDRVPGAVHDFTHIYVTNVTNVSAVSMFTSSEV